MTFYGLGPRSYEVREPFYGQGKPFYGPGKTFYSPGKSSYRPLLRLFPNKTTIFAAGSVESPFGPANPADPLRLPPTLGLSRQRLGLDTEKLFNALS